MTKRKRSTIRTIAEFEKAYFPVREEKPDLKLAEPKSVASSIANDLLKSAERRLKSRLNTAD